MNTHLLSIEHLSVVAKKSPHLALVDDVSLQAFPGKTTCVVGESGSGKSLTSLSILGLLGDDLQKTGGNILFGVGDDAVDLSRLSDKSLQAVRGRRIGMIFQEPMTSLNPVLTIGYQIGEGLTHHLGLRGMALQSRVAHLLEQVGISSSRAQSYPHELSGGQRQRVMIAMSIACMPELLIADEPTTALDMTVQAQILTLLTSLRKEMNMALLLITHDFGIVADMADTVVVMFRGKVVESGTAEAVLNKPQHPYTQALLACIPDAQGLNPLKPMTYDWL